jgi:putative ABC transport system ATP-binding protein
VSLTIEKGEFVAIMGRSGAGKSTLLYQLSLLDTPTNGSIMIGGVDTGVLTREQRTDFRLRELGYIFQDYALLPELTALENTALPLIMQGERMVDAYRSSAVALTAVGLEHRFGSLPSQLSGGEQQRVSIARSIAHAPKILFADEPTANLDSETAKQVLDIFRTLNKNGQTIIMVTHEKEYGELADRTVRLLDGKIIG